MRTIFEKNKTVMLLSILVLIGILVAPLANAQEAVTNNEEKKSPEQLAVIDIDIKIGPVRIRIQICCTNEDTVPAEDVAWNFDVTGFCLYGAHHDGIIPLIQPGETIETEPFFVFGLGPAEIAASCGDSIDTLSCFLLGPFVLGGTDTY